MNDIRSSGGSLANFQEPQINERIAEANKTKDITKELQDEIDKMKRELNMNDKDLEESYKESDKSGASNLNEIRQLKKNHINDLLNFPKLSKIMENNNRTKLELLGNDERVKLLNSIAVTNFREKETEKIIIEKIKSLIDPKNLEQPTGGGKKKRTYKKKKKRRSKKKGTPMKRKKTPIKKKNSNLKNKI